MKKIFLLWIAISAAVLLGSCADQPQSTTTTSTKAVQGPYEPGIAGTGGGGGGGGHFPVRTQP